LHFQEFRIKRRKDFSGDMNHTPMPYLLYRSLFGGQNHLSVFRVSTNEVVSVFTHSLRGMCPTNDRRNPCAWGKGTTDESDQNKCRPGFISSNIPTWTSRLGGNHNYGCQSNANQDAGSDEDLGPIKDANTIQHAFSNEDSNPFQNRIPDQEAHANKGAHAYANSGT
jgi:hypothetical protein